jgi:hypothetical protein
LTQISVHHGLRQWISGIGRCLCGNAIGSRISYQALGAYRFAIGSTGSIAWSGVLGYLALYVDYIQGSGPTLLEMNLLQHGPLLGLSARF